VDIVAEGERSCLGREVIRPGKKWGGRERGERGGGNQGKEKLGEKTQAGGRRKEPRAKKLSTIHHQGKNIKSQGTRGESGEKKGLL